jgi:hypothetical protein
MGQGNAVSPPHFKSIKTLSSTEPLRKMPTIIQTVLELLASDHYLQKGMVLWP